MQLKSSAFKEGEPIPRQYTCQGVDINPPLSISEVPKEAQSLALIVEDPDVPEYLRKDRMWDHWVVYNIDPKTNEIQEGAPSLGMQGRNTGGQNRYMGPCPPDREHRYFFKLFALDVQLSLDEGATKKEVLTAMEGHILAQSQLMGRFEKG